MGMVMTVRGARRTEQIVSKWRPTISLATERANKVLSDYLKLRQNDDRCHGNALDRKEQIYVQIKLRG